MAALRTAAFLDNSKTADIRFLIQRAFCLILAEDVHPGDLNLDDVVDVKDLAYLSRD